MYIIVKIIGAKVDKLIPLKWIKGLDYSMVFNYGTAWWKKQKVLIFYSKNFDEEPTFGAPLEAFDENRMTACYTAKIVDFFGLLFLYFCSSAFISFSFY